MTTSSKPRRAFGRAFRNLFGIGISIYGITVSLFLLLRFIVGETFLPVAMYNTVAHLLWIGAIVLIPVCLILRLWRVILLLIVPALAFVYTYGEQFIQTPNDYRGSQTFSLLTYNILFRSSDYQDSTALILDADADIVALQELGENAAATFDASLAEAYPYRALYPHFHGTVGQGLLSRYPILESTVWQSDFLPNSFRTQRAVLDVNGTEIVVYNIHHNHPLIGEGFFDVNQRRLQVIDLLQRVEAETSRVVLLGDFNMVDLNEDYGRIRERFSDAYFDAGYGLGWTFNAGPGFITLLGRIDYIFFDFYGMDAVSAQVWNTSGGSDHRPVRAELAIYDPTASEPD